MSRILLFALLSSSVLAAGSCTGWQDETKGLGPALATTASSVGGGGGGDPCISCSAFFTDVLACQPPDCPSPDDVCDGPAADALDGFMNCAFCDACAAECPDLCGAADVDISDLSGPCETCMTASSSSTCATQVGVCFAN